MKAGDRVKTDRRDAMMLAKLHRAGGICDSDRWDLRAWLQLQQSLLQSGQKLGILDTLFTNRLDFFGKVRGPRAVCTGFHGVALIEAMEIVIETFIRAFYELLKGVDRKITVLVVDRLDTRTIDRK
jgi:hypothetical protein